MPSKGKPEKKASGSKGRAPSSRGGKRPASAPRKASQSKGEGVLAQIQKPRFLPFLTVWLLAIAVLAGLIYWGDSSKLPGSKASHRAHTASREKSGAHPQARNATPKEQATTSVSPSNGASSAPSKATTVDKGPVSPPPAKASTSKSDERLALALSSPAPPPPPAAPPGPTLTPSVARVAIVIDDMGGDMDIAIKLLALPFPLTFSVLPYLRHSREVAELAYRQGHEVMLHMPMEPMGYPRTDPGKGALLLSMSESQITQAVQAAIDSCPHVSGINNHMGSKFTADVDHMKLVIHEVGRRKLFFLDSHTSPRSVGYSVAQDLDVPSVRRDVFLDHTDTEEAIQDQLVRLIRKAKLQGRAVAIGHPHEATYNVLSRAVSLFRTEGIEVVPAGQLVTAAPKKPNS